MSTLRPPEAPGAHYDRVAQRSARTVIAGYSTSFGWAVRLLEEPVRTHVRSIYALVRVADETVDDPDPLLPNTLRAQMLDDLAAETARAVQRGRSTNLVVQAFAITARRHGIGPELLDPFFASMRADLAVSEHDQASLQEYVHGSAEVVGLMCLRVFVAGDDAAYARLREPAQSLGAAFQKVNFLRDLAEDHDQLGRAYFPGLDPAELLRRASRPAARRHRRGSRPRRRRDPPPARRKPSGGGRRARAVQRAVPPAAGHPRRGDPPHPGAGPRSREGADPRARAAAGRRA